MFKYRRAEKYFGNLCSKILVAKVNTKRQQAQKMHILIAKFTTPLAKKTKQTLF